MSDDFTCCTGLHLAIGIDPGPVTGIAMVAHNAGAWTTLAAQCSHALTRSMLSRFIDDTCVFGVPVHVGIEDFVTSKRASRSATASAGQIARDLVAQIEADAAGWPQLVHLHKRNAGNVKPWATDERLEAAGAIEAAKGMRHARDAARHALYALCRDGDAHDPLGRTAQTGEAASS